METVGAIRLRIAGELVETPPGAGRGLPAERRHCTTAASDAVAGRDEQPAAVAHEILQRFELIVIQARHIGQHHHGGIGERTGIQRLGAG